jgi:hypothetical protein
MQEERLEVVPFRRSDELKKALASVPDPLYMLRAIGPKKRMLASGCEEQTALNAAIRDYIRNLVEKAKIFSMEKNIALGVAAYREARIALSLCNTQRTVHIPSEILEAEEAFDDLIEALAPLGKLFPPETQPIFWKVCAFRKSQALTTTIHTPYGPMTVGVEREARDPRWWPFIELRDPSGSRKERADYYILAGTLSRKGGSISATPLYDAVDGSFWGLEVLWITRMEKRFAWEVRVTGGVHFSLVREDPETPLPWEVRQGDVFFSPVEYLYGVYEEQGVPELIHSCEFSPAPLRWLRKEKPICEGEYVAQFEGTNEVIIRHPDHPAIRVLVGKVGIRVRPVGGHTHYQPPRWRGD